MAVEIHAPMAESRRGGCVEEVDARGADISRRDPPFKDFFPRLGAMRRLVGAEGSAVFSCPTMGRVGGQMPLVFHDESYGACAIKPNSAYGRLLLAHCERSVLPVAWAGPRGGEPGYGCRRATVAGLHLPEASVPGIAFPVRLGNIGNGVIVFEDADVGLTAENIFAVHRMAYRLMADLFRVEISRSTPKQNLSERELECLQWAGDGCKSEAIAERLGLSVHTVNAYLGSATAKLEFGQPDPGDRQGHPARSHRLKWRSKRP